MVMKKIFIIIGIWLVLMAFAAIVGDVAIAGDFGTTTGDFLNIASDARGLSMAGAQTGLADNAGAARWNPAGLTGLGNTEFSFTHLTWYQDLALEHFAVATPFNEKLTIGVDATYLGLGDIEGYDINDMPTGVMTSSYNMCAGISLGYRLWDNLALGLTGKYIQLSLAEQKASAFAGDIGLRLHYDRVALGVVLANLGQKIKFDQVEEDLPTTIRAGIAVVPFGSALTAAVDVEKPLNGDVSIHTGLEYRHGRYFLRSGLSGYPYAQDELGQGLSFGAGADLGRIRLDYTYCPDDRISTEDLHAFSVSFALGKGVERLESKTK